MTIIEIISLVGLILVNITALVISYNKTTSWVKVKIKELDMKIDALKSEHDHHCKWGENEQRTNQDKFNLIEKENKEDHKQMIIKMDTILSQLNKFMLEIIQKIN